MNVLTILFITLGFFIGYQLVAYIVAYSFIRFFKIKKRTGPKLSLALSLVLLFAFLMTLLISISIVYFETDLSSLDLYLAFSLTGLCSILWCYFDSNIFTSLLYDLENPQKGFFSTIKPVFASPENLASKKTIIFSLVLIFSFILGYQQFSSYVTKKNVDVLYSLSNITVVSSMIALDRVMSQLHTLNKLKKD